MVVVERNELPHQTLWIHVSVTFGGLEWGGRGSKVRPSYITGGVSSVHAPGFS